MIQPLSESASNPSHSPCCKKISSFRVWGPGLPKERLTGRRVASLFGFSEWLGLPIGQIEELGILDFLGHVQK